MVYAKNSAIFSRKYKVAKKIFIEKNNWQAEILNFRTIFKIIFANI